MYHHHIRDQHGTGNQGGNPGTNQGNPTSGTPTGVVTPTPLLPFMAGLVLPDFSEHINDSLLHDATWPTIPTKLPSYIPNFAGNTGKDPTNHVHPFYMWCSSNSIIEDSIHLQFFQHTLTGDAAKWYVD